MSGIIRVTTPINMGSDMLLSWAIRIHCVASASSAGRDLEQIAACHSDCLHDQVLAFARLMLARPI